MGYHVSCGLIQLALFLAITVITPLLLRLEEGYNYNDPRYMHRLVDNLRSKKPEILLIGNSMLYTRIDGNELEKISGKRISLLTKGGSASACWYLYLKNIVAASGIQPEQVIIFFRDKVLTSPEYRTEGYYGDYIQRLQAEKEPLIHQILDSRRNSPFGLSSTIRKIYGINTQPRRLQSKLHDLALDLTEAGSNDQARHLVMNKRFSIDNLRHDLVMGNTAEEPSVNTQDESKLFNPAPGSSFLPHMIDLADQFNTNLCFYRVRNRSREMKHPLKANYIDYLRDLEDYLESRHILTLVEAGESIPTNWFSEGDHISEDHRAEYTRLFWSNIKDSLPVAP